MGRPVKISLDVQERVTNAIKLGATYEFAARYAGVSPDSLSRWMQQGEASKDGPYRGLYDAVKLAEGSAVIQWLARIEKAAADGNWQAAAWKLERRYPEIFGRRERITIDVNKLDSDIERELAAITAGSQAALIGEAESETVN